MENPIELPLNSMRCLFGLSLSEGSEIKVLDFGGACGAHYFLAKKILGEKYKIKWYVVETEAMVRAAKTLENENLKFYSSISDAILRDEKFDLIFTSGTLQYASDPRSTLDELMSVGAKNLFITRLPLSDHTLLISTQTSDFISNGPGALPNGFVNAQVRYPITFIPKADFEAQLKKNYTITIRFDEDQTVIDPSLGLVNMHGYYCTLNP